jgi:hypothetical protein
MYLKLAPTYYATDNVRGNDFSLHGSGTNTVDANGDLVFEYNAWAADVELGVRLSGPVPFASIYGQYVNSTAKDSVRPTSVGSDDNIGWLAGVKFGHKKVKKFGQWQAKLNYRELETDAWPDFLPDSDFYDGATNAKGHEIELALGLNEHVTLGFDYYHTEPIRIPAGATSLDQDLVQIDLVLKW